VVHAGRRNAPTLLYGLDKGGIFDIEFGIPRAQLRWCAIEQGRVKPNSVVKALNIE
jgi:hypothetical protein